MQFSHIETLNKKKLIKEHPLKDKIDFNVLNFILIIFRLNRLKKK